MNKSTADVLAFKNQSHKHILSKKVAITSILQTLFQGM